MIKHDRSFWCFFAIMTGLTVIIILINIYSPVSMKELTEVTAKHIMAAEKSLISIEEDFDKHGRIIDLFAEKLDDLKLLTDEIEAVEKEFLADNNMLLGVFYQITSDDISRIGGYIDDSGISDKQILNIINISEGISLEAVLPEAGNKDEGTWRKGIYADTLEECYIYIRPVFSENEQCGYIGMILSTAYIMEEIETGQGNQELNYYLFADEAEARQEFKEISLHDWKDLFIFEETSVGYLKNQTGYNEEIYTLKVLDTGMVYIEVYTDLKQARHSNAMIILISIFSIAAMLMAQGRDKSGRTVFDHASEYIMKNYINNINSIKKQGHRATIALNIGMVAAIFADVIYSITLGRGVKTLAEYIIFLVLSSSVLVIYKLNKAGITEKTAYIIITAGLAGPLLEHIMSGGFAMGKAGESFLWFIVCQYIALFILGADKAVHVINAVVVLLYFTVVLEAVLFQSTNYEASYLFTASFLLLGFSLYNAMEVYVSNAASYYKQTKKLIKELETNQDLLLKKEKLSALGQLISGVAHEINTPIGAIKASAETMDSLFIKIIEEILSAAENCSEKEYEAFLELVLLALNAKHEMKPTLEVRKDKKEVKKYFEDIKLNNRNHILSLLGELEIVNLDQIKQNIELLQMDNIADVLERVTKLTAFVSGIPIIIYASDRVSKIVLALKSYVHTSSTGTNIEFDLVMSIENVLVLFRNQLKSDIEIERIYDLNPCIITGNPDELAQVWSNLIQNAVQAMEGLDTSTADTNKKITIKICELDENTIEVSICDKGKGIAENMLRQIYEPFYTTKQSGEGIGIGLSITKRIIDKHYGTVNVESRLGIGTVFHVCLPKRSKL